MLIVWLAALSGQVAALGEPDAPALPEADGLPEAPAEPDAAAEPDAPGEALFEAAGEPLDVAAVVALALGDPAVVPEGAVVPDDGPQAANARLALVISASDNKRRRVIRDVLLGSGRP